MSSLALSLKSTPNEYALLLTASIKFNAGQTEEAQEHFTEASTQVPVELVQNIYFKVWVLSNRPEGDSNFGEKAMHNRLINLTPPDNIVKARAIIEALIEHCPGAIPTFLDELNHAERCPISCDRMGKPTIIFSGCTFELSQIQEWQRQQMRQGLFSQITCPSTKSKGPSQFIPNRALGEVIQTTERFERRLQVTPLLTQYLFQENVRHTEKIERYKQKMEVLKERNVQNERIIGEFTLQRYQTGEEIRVLTEQNQMLHHQHQETQQQNQGLRELNQEALQQNQGLREQNQALVQRLDGLLERNQTLATANQTLATANQTLVQENQHKDRHIRDLTQDLQRERQFWTLMFQFQNRTMQGLQRRVNGLEPEGANLLVTTAF